MEIWSCRSFNGVVMNSPAFTTPAFDTMRPISKSRVASWDVCGVGTACVCGLAKPARREELLAGQPPRVRAGEEDRDGSDVSRLPGAAQRGLRGRVLLPVGADEAPGARALGVDHARVDGVDPDLLRPQLAGEDARNPVDGGLGAGVHRAVRRR